MDRPERSEFVLELSFFDTLKGQHRVDTRRRLATVDLGKAGDFLDIGPFFDSVTSEFHPLGFGNEKDGFWKVEKVFSDHTAGDDVPDKRLRPMDEVTFREFECILQEWTEYWSR